MINSEVRFCSYENIVTGFLFLKKKKRERLGNPVLISLVLKYKVVVGQSLELWTTDLQSTNPNSYTIWPRREKVRCHQGQNQNICQTIRPH